MPSWLGTCPQNRGSGHVVGGAASQEAGDGVDVATIPAQGSVASPILCSVTVQDLSDQRRMVGAQLGQGELSPPDHAVVSGCGRAIHAAPHPW